MHENKEKTITTTSQIIDKFRYIILKIFIRIFQQKTKMKKLCFL